MATERHHDHDIPHAIASPVPGTADATWLPPESPERGLPATPQRAQAALVALCAAAFLLVTNEIAPLGLIRVMGADLGVSESRIGLLTTGFATTVMLATLPLTLLTTRLPRRHVLTGVLAFWTAGVLVLATADSFAVAMTGRVMTAMAHALFWAVATPAAAGMFAPHLRGRYVSRLLVGGSCAGVIGLPVATWVGQQTSWQVPFWGLAVGGALTAVAIAVLMPTFTSSEGSAARGDVPSLARFARVLTVVLLTCTAMGTTWTYITPFFVDVARFADSTVPVLLAFGGAVGLVSMWLVGRFLDRWPVKAVAVGEALLLTMWLGLASAGDIKAVAVAMLVLQGLAWSILCASMVNWCMRHTPWSSDIGVGLYASTFNAGNALGATVGAAALATWSAAVLPWLSAGLTAVAAIVVLLVAPGAIKSLRKPPRRPRTASRPASPRQSRHQPKATLSG